MAKGSRLGKVQGGVLDEGLRFLFYSVEGFGKTTLAAHAPDAIALDCEDSSGKVDVHRYSFRDGRGGHVPQTYIDVLDAIGDLADNEHRFRTVIIDTVDRLEGLIWADICKKRGVANVGDVPFGNGYNYALEAWRDLCRRLDELRTTRGMHIVLLGHAQIRTFRDPEGEDYDRYQLRLHEKASGLVREWADVIGFGRFEAYGALLPETAAKRVKAAGSGRRVLHFHRRPAYDAKTRLPLPAELPLPEHFPWAPIGRAIVESRYSAAQLRELIEKELARIDDGELVDKVCKRVDQVGDNRSTLLRLFKAVQAKPSAVEAQPPVSPPANEAAAESEESA